MNNIMLAAISGEAMVNAVIWIIIAAVVYWLVNWAVAKIGVPEPFNKVIQVIIVLATVLFLINGLLTLVGHPIIDWHR